MTWLVAMVQALTLLIAAFVAWIGYLQWRTAQQKAVLDLFDKRFKIYETVKNCVDQVGRNPLYFSEREKEFLKAVNEAYFLFGDDLHGYLETLRKDIVYVRDFDTQGPGAGVAGEKRMQAMIRINEFYQTGQPLFAKYMRFSQTVPSGVVPTIRRIASSAWQRSLKK
jgi:hypothetical protein